MREEEKRPVIEGFVLQPGTRLAGRVTIQDVLGCGGFGITYVAVHKAFGRVALKEFMPRSMVYGRRNNTVSVMQDKQDLFDTCKRQFMRESRILRTLKNPNIVHVLDEFEENGTAYYVMELLEGETLGAYVRKRGAPLDPLEACELLMPVIEAVEYLHSYENKVLHRDISPDNILLSRTATGIKPYLIDFGAAFSAQADFTQTFPKVKKNGYSPLEQYYNYGNEAQGTWSDVYSMSATFYYAVTNTKPIPASERGVGRNDTMTHPKDINPAVSKTLDAVLMHGLALQAKDRIRHMADLRQGIVDATGYIPPESVVVSEYESDDEGPPSVPHDRVDLPPPVVKPVGFGSLAALLLDWGICWAMPAIIVGLLTSPPVGIAAGAIVSIAINGTLAPSGGTVGQRLMNCPVKISGIGKGFLYSLLRHVVPLALIDEIMAIRSGKHFIDQLVGCEENAIDDVKPELPYQLRCVAGFGQGKLVMLNRSKLFGRGSDADLRFPEDMCTVSAHHCSLFVDENGWHVVDMNSRNGTMLNGERLLPFETSRALRVGDRISIASKSTFIFEQAESYYSATGGSNK